LPLSSRAALGTLLWMVAPLCVILAGWAGLLAALPALAYGTHLLRRTVTVPELSASGRP
jgi:hypothetical protein